MRNVVGMLLDVLAEASVVWEADELEKARGEPSKIAGGPEKVLVQLENLRFVRCHVNHGTHERLESTKHGKS